LGLSGVYWASTMHGIKIHCTKEPEHLAQVKQLWRRDAKTLGFFPDGAFQDAFARGRIIVALDDSDRCRGYLLYRISRDAAAIVHLCVAKKSRGQGIARELVGHLVQTTKHLRGVSLRCRRDYETNTLWPKMGFAPGPEVRGRGSDGGVLVNWWRPQQEVTLFSAAAKSLRDSKIAAVLDASVFYELAKDRPPYDEPCKSLQADYLADELELFLTDEMDIEFSRQDEALRQQNSRFASQFHRLPCDAGRFDVLQNALRQFFPETMSVQDESDMRHLARAIAGGARYFVTRDGGLLNLASPMEERYRISILDPTTLISRLDELRRGAEYEPVRFVGSPVRIAPVRASDIESLAACFCNRQAGERQAAFRSRLRTYVASPDAYTCQAVHDQGQPLALLVTQLSPEDDRVLELTMIRVRSDSTAPTMARQLARQSLLLSRAAHRSITMMTDDRAQEAAIQAIEEAGFSESTEGWIKINFCGTARATEIAAFVRDLDHPGIEVEGLDEWADLLQRQADVPGAASLDEHYLWPGKIADAALATYIVPIQPRWAEQLFDEGLARQSLFGRDRGLALNVEGVYYRAARPALEWPGRILWYVSGKGDETGIKRLRACSRLDQVEIGKPKELFRKYRRLGVYQWRDVYTTAKHDVERPIMVLRFSDTELFEDPIPYGVLQTSLRKAGIRTQLQCPVRVPANLFTKLYERACRNA